MSRFARRVTIALVLTTASIVVALIGVNVVIDHELARIARVQGLATVAALPGGANYLLIGSDSRAFVRTKTDVNIFGNSTQTSGSRSDTLMVLHVESSAQRTLIVSFPRDLWVRVPGVGMSKLNSAFDTDTGGGPNRVIATLKENFDLAINHYIEIDFQSFEGIVNAIGGVPVYVPAPALDTFTGFVAVNAGCYHLNGFDALQWVRARHIKFLDPRTGKLQEDLTEDIGRINRQQDFIRRLAALAVHKSLSNPLTANQIASNVVSHLKVDAGLSKDDIFALVDAFRGINPNDTSALEFHTFAGRLGTAGGQSVLFPEVGKERPLLERLRSFDDQPTTATPASTPSNLLRTAPTMPSIASSVDVRVLNASGTVGKAATALIDLEHLGYRPGGVATDPRGSVSATEIRYPTNGQAAARLLAASIRPTPALVADPTLAPPNLVLVLGTNFRFVVAATPTATTPGLGTQPTPSATPSANPADQCQ